MLLDRNLGSLHHDANTMFEGMASISGVKIGTCLLKKSWKAWRI